MCWPVWRLILEKVTTLQEVESWYSVDDVDMANDALDLKHKWEAEARQRAEAKAKEK